MIALLEKFLEMANEHPFGAVAIALSGHGGAAVSFGGEIALEKAQHATVGRLHAALGHAIENGVPPPQDESLDASFVCWNMSTAPACFDFGNWLVEMEMARKREGAPAPLKVGFFCGRDPVNTMTKNDRQGWLDNVFRPMLPMIGAVEDDRAIMGRRAERFTPSEIVKASQRGDAVPRLRSVANTLFANRLPKDVVTLTLREHQVDAARNSNVSEWLAFARYLEGQGERVVIVRDTAKAHEPLEGFETCPLASTDLHARMALYEAAKINFFGENGPVTLGIFGSRPWVSFVAVEGEDCEERVRQPSFWRDAIGLDIGEQYPWSSPDQRIVWKPDSFENMTEAWGRFRARAVTHAEASA